MVVLILLALVGIETTAHAAEDVKVAQLSGIYKPTYLPPGAADSVQIQSNTYTQNSQGQIHVNFRLLDELNQPVPGAQLNCRDGAGNSINSQGLAVILDTPAGQRHNPAKTITDNNGNVTIEGYPGTWQFSVYKSGYFSNALTYPFTYDTSMVLILQEVGPLEKLDPSGNRGKNESTLLKIVMPAFCSNTSNDSGNGAIGQSTSTNAGAMG